MSYPKKLVVLGAGFSCPMGIPAMSGILCRFKKLPWHKSHTWSIHGIDIPEAKAAHDTFLDWESVDANVEVYGDTLIRMSGHSTFELKRFSRVFIRGLELVMQSEDQAERECLWCCLYQRFARDLLNTPDIEVCTFNYDLLLDQAIMAVGALPEYCLGSKEVLYVNEGRPPGVNLLKPNGSLNWLVCDLPFDVCNTVTVKFDKPDPHLPANWGTGREKHTGHGRCPHLHSDLHFLMVPPGMKQRPTEWAALTSLQRVHERLFDVSRNAEEIYFVGWSAPDTDWDWARKYWGHTRATVHVVGRNESTDIKGRYCRLVDKSEKDINWHLGPDKGDAKDYSKSDWRKALLS
ncbi:MAG: hypothetical protein AMXMBFR84_16670 [Candidatus Hydrogenedentota bacterium]